MKICNQAFVKDKYRDKKFAGTMKCFYCSELSNLPKLPVRLETLTNVLSLFVKLHDSKGCNDIAAEFTKDASSKIDIPISN